MEANKIEEGDQPSSILYLTYWLVGHRSVQLKAIDGTVDGLVITITPGMFPQTLPFAITFVKKSGSVGSGLLNLSFFGAIPPMVTVA